MKKSAATRCLLFLAVTALVASPAWAGLIDFEDTGPFPRIASSITSHGYNFAPAGATVATMFNGQSCIPSCAANGTATFVAGGLSLNPPSIHPVTMSSASGLSFILSALDYAEFVGADATSLNATRIVMRGNLVSGGTVSQTLILDGLNDGPGGANDFESAALAAFWATSRLTSLEFTGFNDLTPFTPRGFQLDNIEVVPEPGTVLIVGTGLLALFTYRRRRMP